MQCNLDTIQVHDHHLSPALAEIWFTVPPQDLPPGSELRGQVRGPRCRFASTVEIAYPMRPPGHTPGGTTLRAVIPEPNWWEPASPFLYVAKLEVWADGQCFATNQLTHGLRSFQLGLQGFRCNGRPLVLCGQATDGCTEEHLRMWRQAGCNTLLVSAERMHLWPLVSEWGFLMIGRITGTTNLDKVIDQVRAQHPCTFGWLAAPEIASRPGWQALVEDLRETAGGKAYPWFGMEVDCMPTASLPEWASFVAGPASYLTASLPLPRLVIDHEPCEASVMHSGILGWMRE